MAQKKNLASTYGDPVAAVIGDVVGSRDHADRPDLHVRLVGRLAELEELLRAEERAGGEPMVVSPPRVTVGDEYQAIFTTLGAALRATRWLRISLLPDVDVRHGIGWGPVQVLEDEPRVEDGPGWWAAREAIDEVKQLAAKPATRHLRTAFRRASGSDGPDPNPVNAALMCRDQMVGSVSERSLRLLRGTVDGRTQTELADDEGISASAVSQRVRRDGLAVIVTADELLRRAQ